MAVISKKICLLGDFSVGKTSLIRRFIEGKFSDQYLTTVGVKISRKSLKLDALEQTINFILWDIEGQTKFQSITPSYLQGSTGVIIVGDLTRPETLSSLQKHLELFLQINPQGIAVVALNKTDLVAPEKLSKLLEQYSFSNQTEVLASYGTSAKSGNCVNEMFQQLAQSILA
ncbi:small GTP-binding protein domain protein [Xenococcus sp. PCC 7305]|uniref:Rab family GTPase n=1 Tax=Xenococcus sp. PCC 7305 TaxID=102125 RepID=UPI0002AC86C9|nr:Rab family GTPase [Xenococcus sp. PCC 7305]ELS03933.1 small GTP-binding protein domain protein [Xenococcus sp. PCC 7305]